MLTGGVKSGAIKLQAYSSGQHSDPFRAFESMLWEEYLLNRGFYRCEDKFLNAPYPQPVEELNGADNEPS